MVQAAAHDEGPFFPVNGGPYASPDWRGINHEAYFLVQEQTPHLKPPRDALKAIARIAAEGRRAVKVAFAAYMLAKLWVHAGRSCEAVAMEVFQISRRTFYNWKKSLGYVDETRSESVADALAPRSGVGAFDAPSRRFSEWCAGAQLSLDFSQRVIEPTVACVQTVEEFVRSQDLSDMERGAVRRVGLALIRLAKVRPATAVASTVAAPAPDDDDLDGFDPDGADWGIDDDEEDDDDGDWDDDD